MTMSPGSPPAESADGAERPRVGYLGPEGTFTEEALLASACASAVEPVALRTIYDTILALRRGDVEWAVVPIENSLDGSVSVTLDLLAEEDAGLEIVAEALLSVRHSLIAGQDLGLDEIETVLTHPQVPGQCERLLRGELGHATVLAASSTAEAVRDRLRRWTARAGGSRNYPRSRDLRRNGDQGRSPGQRRQRDAVRMACALGRDRSASKRGAAAAAARRGRVEDLSGLLGSWR